MQNNNRTYFFLNLGANATIALLLIYMFFTPIVWLFGGMTKGHGASAGVIVDVSWEGWLFKTCEVDLQYGESSSRIEKFSSKDKVMCKELGDNYGKTVVINYDQTMGECLTCASDDLIRKFEVK